MQDIAGARLIAGEDRFKQDQVMARIVELFPKAEVMDRREVPSYGYRAVHVIVEMDKRFVEIQIRTVLQDLWAQVVERLADRWGRGIRYGDPPNDPDAEVVGGITRREVVDALMSLSDAADGLEKGTVRLVKAEAELAKVDSILPSAPATPEVQRLQQRRDEIQGGLQELREMNQRELAEMQKVFVMLRSLK
jgi:ppGpp synthetase/RelA/SpoT-type nucleotidyltranferase